jgi:hypothetical protein
MSDLAGPIVPEFSPRADDVPMATNSYPGSRKLARAVETLRSATRMAAKISRTRRGIARFISTIFRQYARWLPAMRQMASRKLLRSEHPNWFIFDQIGPGLSHSVDTPEYAAELVPTAIPGSW